MAVLRQSPLLQALLLHRYLPLLLLPRFLCKRPLVLHRMWPRLLRLPSLSSLLLHLILLVLLQHLLEVRLCR